MYPNYLTHYYTEFPFRSIMDLAPAEQVRLVRRIRALGNNRRRLTVPNYYMQRRRYEAIMREQFLAKGGRPARRHPHYLVLGESELWARQKTKSIRIPLASVPSDVISFTYTDSWYTYVDRELTGGEIPRKPQYNQVFRAEELEALFAEYGWPGDRWKQWRTQPQFRHDYYVEAQVWTDDPLRQFLRHDAA